MKGGRDPHHSRDMMLNRVFQVDRRREYSRKEKRPGQDMELALHICGAVSRLIQLGWRMQWGSGKALGL